MERYDIAVIGAGSGGLVVAAGAAAFGARVALFEKHQMGGDCLNTGCVPSKALLHSARVAAEMRRAARAGIEPVDPRIDSKTVFDAVRAVQAKIAPNDSKERFTSLGVDVFLGSAAKFTGRGVVTNGETTLRARHVVLATGSRAAAPPVEGLSEAGFLTNETIFDLDRIPARLAVIGGGPIGCELGQAFARLGSKVTIVEMAGRILFREDADLGAVLEASLVADGVSVMTGASIRRVRSSKKGKSLEIETAAGTKTIEVDEILVAAGRRPNVEGLGLEEAGVEATPKGIRVDERLRATVPGVWAVGDVAGSYQFTHAANWMARVVLRNILFPGSAKVDWSTTPWCVFTDPEVARVGISEEEAQAKGIEIDVYRHPFSELDRAICERSTEGFAKAIVARGTDRILGGAIVGAHAGELIHEIALAKRHRIGLSGLSFGKTIHAYPTWSEVVSRLGDAYMKTRLTPNAKKIAKWWVGRGA